MGSWRKRLREMAADPDPRSYTYDEAANILSNLGFLKAKGGGSHRKFRYSMVNPDSPKPVQSVIVGLVEAGSGCLKPAYIVQMVRTLRENNLIPPEVE